MPNTPASSLEIKAWNFAKDKHKDQIRKFVNKPYFDAHVQKVNGILKKYTTDPELLAASLLHDVIEDCFDDKYVGYQVIKESFGERVADIVFELTSDKNEIEKEYFGNKSDYLIDKMMNMSDDALTIKLCDRLQNISDAFTASAKFREKYYNETVSIVEQIEKNRNLNGTHKLLLEDIKSKMNNVENMFKIKRFEDI